MDLTALLLVSDVILTDDDPDAANVTGNGTAFPGLRIEVRNAEGVKCPRCWMHSTKANADGLCRAARPSWRSWTYGTSE